MKESSDPSKNKNGNGPGKTSPSAQGREDKSSESSQKGNSKSQGSGKAQDSEKPQLTPDQKAAQGILGGRLSKDELVAYAKDNRCFKCHTVGHLKKDCPKLDKSDKQSSEEVSPDSPAVNAIHRHVPSPVSVPVIPPPVLEAKQEGVASMQPPLAIRRVSRAIVALSIIEVKRPS